MEPKIQDRIEFSFFVFWTIAALSFSTKQVKNGAIIGFLDVGMNLDLDVDLDLDLVVALVPNFQEQCECQFFLQKIDLSPQ